MLEKQIEAKVCDLMGVCGSVNSSDQVKSPPPPKNENT